MFNNTHPAETLLSEALTLAQQELEALDNEQEEILEELAAKRAELINRAWDQRFGLDEKKLDEMLQKLREMQEQLIAKAEERYRVIKKQLTVRKKQTGYFTNAYVQQSYSNKAYYMNKIS